MITPGDKTKISRNKTRNKTTSKLDKIQTTARARDWDKASAMPRFDVCSEAIDYLELMALARRTTSHIFVVVLRRTTAARVTHRQFLSVVRPPRDRNLRH
jgi:hypothetical protein